MGNVTIFAKTEFRGRKSVRIRDHDYSRTDSYFVTVCVRERCPLFGKVIDGVMHTNIVGKTVEERWRQMPDRYPGVRLDEFVVMPDHFHGIISIRSAYSRTPRLGQVIGTFKSLIAHDYILGVKDGKLPSFGRSFWQRNYHERVIRNDRDLEAYRRYVRDNPKNWHPDDPSFGDEHPG